MVYLVICIIFAPSTNNFGIFAMAKVSTATVRLVLKKNRKNKNDEYPVYIVVCFGGRVEKATGVSVKERYWDAKREVIKAGCPNAPVLNRMLLDVKQRVLDRKSDYEYAGKRYTPSMLLQDSVVDLHATDTDFCGLCDRIIEERRLKAGTTRTYTYTRNKLGEYLKRKDFVVDELVLSVIKDFIAWLERNSIKSNTIKRVLSCIASVWNYAISKKLVDGSDYPFNEFKYTTVYKDIHRDYYLTEEHVRRLRDYWLDMVIVRDGKRWRYSPGAEERLHQRWTPECGIMWFLLMYKFNGSAPADVALIRPGDCKRITINNEDYWSIDIKRKKTGRDVHIRLKRDMFTIITLEHFLGTSGHFIYPMIYWREGITDKELLEQCHHVSDKAIKHVRKAFESINLDIAKDNVEQGLTEPVVDVARVVMYTMRHSFAQHYLSRPTATVNGLASLMARSPNTISCYISQLTRDEEIAEMVDGMVI